VAGLMTIDWKPTLIFLTSTMAEAHPELLNGITYLFIDEYPTVNQSQFEALLSKASDLKKVILTGDEEQLGPNNMNINRCVQNLGFQSCADSVRQLDAFIPRITLDMDFRHHYVIGTIMSRAFYGGILRMHRPQGEATIVNEQAVNLPVQGIPLILIHADQVPAERDQHMSWGNRQHAEIAIRVSQVIAAGLRPDINRAETDALGLVIYRNQGGMQYRAFTQMGIPVETIDAVQGRESSFVSIAMTRTTGDMQNQTEQSLSFTLRDRACVTMVGRSRHFLALVADFNLLCRNDPDGRPNAWTRWTQEAVRFAPIMNADYVQYMRTTTPIQRNRRGVALGPSGTSLIATRLAMNRDWLR